MLANWAKAATRAAGMRAAVALTLDLLNQATQAWVEQEYHRMPHSNPFHVVKNLSKHRKTCYKGLAKNTAQCFTLFGLANLVLTRRWLLVPDGQVAS